MQPKDACRLVCKFRIFTLGDLAAYHRLDWDKTFKVWGDRQRDANGKPFRIFFNTIQQERIKVFAWVCHYWERLGWPTTMTKLGSRLGRCVFTPQCYMRVTMRRDDEEFPGLPTWATMKKQDIGVLHKEIITYCKEHHDAETGMCLGWIVRDNIYAPEWEDKLSLRTQQNNDRPKFFNFSATDELTMQMAPIVPRGNGNASCRGEAVYRERYESGDKLLWRTPQFLAADAIVWNICKHAFKTSQCDVHFKLTNKKMIARGHS
jgi:hypothetical protein